MKMEEVESSIIRAVGYDPDTQELRVQFKDWSIYSYEDVGQRTYDDLMLAPSIGRYFQGCIRNDFKGKRI